MTNKHDFEEEEEEEDDGLVKERRKRRIKSKKKFKKHQVGSSKKMKGFIQSKPRKHDWHELMDDEGEEDYGIDQ